MATLATLSNPHGDVWHVVAGDGQHLTALRGEEEHILETATKYLIGRRNFPAGEWIRRGPGRFSYQGAPL